MTGLEYIVLGVVGTFLMVIAMLDIGLALQVSEFTIVLFNAVAAGVAAYQIIYNGIRDLYKGDNNG